MMENMCMHEYYRYFMHFTDACSPSNSISQIVLKLLTPLKSLLNSLASFRRSNFNTLNCLVEQIRRPLVAVRGSAPRKLLQKIVVERWGTWRARLEHESCCFAWLEHGWLAGFQVLRCAKVCLAWGNLFFLFLVGSKSNVSAFFSFRHFS